MFWTDEREATCLQLWNDGNSAGVIAVRLGTSRNAVIGKLYRLKASKGDRKVVHRVRSSSRIYSREPGARHRDSMVRKREARLALMNVRRRIRGQPEFRSFIEMTMALNAEMSERELARSAADILVPADKRKGVVDLEKDDCRWPMGDPLKPDFHFCHHKAVPGQSYCEFHCRRAYNPPNPNAPRVNWNLGRGPADRSKVVKEFDEMERA